jgi:hypothetical protein
MKTASLPDKPTQHCTWICLGAFFSAEHAILKILNLSCKLPRATRGMRKENHMIKIFLYNKFGAII